MAGSSIEAALDAVAGAARESTGPIEVGVACAPAALGLALADRVLAVTTHDPVGVVDRLERRVRPRWVWWDQTTPATLTAGGVRVRRCWDVAAVHRLLFGGWRADPARAWASLHDRPWSSIPALGQLGLLDDPGEDGDDVDEPRRPDGHLRPEWVAGGWSRDADRAATWAGVALEAAARQRELLAALTAHPALATARSESAAELLAAELAADGLPIDVPELERLLVAAIGPRPSDTAAEEARRRERDEAVLAHAPLGGDRDLRNPAHVRSLLRRVGVEVADTRAWRLEPFRDQHPFVAALLHWRKQERLATTYGYAWLDRHVGPDGRLRGAWTGADGAAGRMTASAGLHNLPAELRPAVAAEAGHVLVRADLGQIEPRVLAAVAGDAALAAATDTDDLYAPVAARLGVSRDAAKVGVLAAMYGQRSGTAGLAFRAMERAYPVAMAYLDAADQAGREGRDVRTYGGRFVRLGRPDPDADPETARRAAAARGRYGRNAVIQGAAAEVFKAWAATVRARLAGSGAGIVLCLHDELLVHAPEADGQDVAATVRSALDEATTRWAPPGPPVRFVVDVAIVRRWSDAK